MGEMPLVLFTILSQLAVGGLIALWLLDSQKYKIGVQTGKIITGALTVALLLALFASVFHLGKPFAAYRAILNFQNSWLSREIILFSVFLPCIAIYFLQWKENNERTRKMVGGMAVVVGLLAIFATGMAYTMPAIPAWNNGAPLVFFYLTAVLLGIPFVSAAVFYLEKKSVSIFKMMTATIVVSLVATILYLTVLSAGSSTMVETATNMFGSPAFWVRAVLTWMVPMVLLGMMCKAKVRQTSAQPNPMILYMLLLTLFVGEFIGRVLFYTESVGLEVTQLFR